MPCCTIPIRARQDTSARFQRLLAYNASLRAVKLGYSNVLWYRGGHEAWRLAGHSFVKVPAGAW